MLAEHICQELNKQTERSSSYLDAIMMSIEKVYV